MPRPTATRLGQPLSLTINRAILAFASLLILLNGAAEVFAATELIVIPSRVTIRGNDSVQQIVAERLDKATASRAFAPAAKMESLDPNVATVDASGTISAQGDGSTIIKVTEGSETVEIPVEVKNFASGAPINFTNQVVPIFSKLGCNSGGCHGKSSGQNGFRLSLLGFEPRLDYETLVKEGRGRRLFPAAPDQSLLLTKAVAKVPHGGGRKMEPGSHEYRVISRWIASGMPFGKDTDPSVTRIEVYPDARVLPRGSKQQLMVTAHYTDGSSEDVTRWAQYQSNDADVASVAEGGLVDTRELSGQAAIMARYQGQVDRFVS